ncbi:hypothetical protein E2562_035702 [Oryza meyeriana var. granulata]|uniref:Uncharacterized protein n=1 Tax=Oryza meyeriana var. granulata TaxID=110450 RepID=A0A6G1C2W6_9ORYZ|nr:hypothetical protein E2562_035702 [Oryza meyeriana var. granulata]
MVRSKTSRSHRHLPWSTRSSRRLRAPHRPVKAVENGSVAGEAGDGKDRAAATLVRRLRAPHRPIEAGEDEGVVGEDGDVEVKAAGRRSGSPATNPRSFAPQPELSTVAVSCEVLHRRSNHHVQSPEPPLLTSSGAHLDLLCLALFLISAWTDDHRQEAASTSGSTATATVGHVVDLRSGRRHYLDLIRSRSHR